MTWFKRTLPLWLVIVLLTSVWWSSSLGQMSVSGRLSFPDGTAALPGAPFAADIDTGFWRPSADIWAVSTTGVERVRGSATSIIFNDVQADTDFIVRSDTNPNFLVMDAGLYGGVGAFGFGSLPSDPPLNSQSVFGYFGHPAMTATAITDWYSYFIPDSGIVTIPTGTAPIATAFRVAPPTLSLAGTVTDAYTVSISGPMTGGTRNGALWVDSGTSRLDGDVLTESRFAATPQAATCASSGDANPGTLTINPTSSVVNITNNDADGCTVTMGETSTLTGSLVTLIVISNAGGTVNFADTAGVSELAGAFAAVVTATLQLVYTNAAWYEVGRSAN